MRLPFGAFCFGMLMVGGVLNRSTEVRGFGELRPRKSYEDHTNDFNSKI
jgi:hypothetical protein